MIPPLDTAVVAPTVFNLQFWLYPFLFFIAYLTPGFAAGAIGGVSTRGFTFLMLANLAFAGMVVVMMGMMNVMFPLLLTLLTIIYAVRK